VLAVGNTALVLHLAKLGSQTWSPAERPWKIREIKFYASILHHYVRFNGGRLSQSHSRQK
jgi:hypothetical protein